MDAMRLLVVSHACVTPINQSFFADVARQTGWQVDLVVPSVWNTEYTSNLAVTRWKDFTGDLHAIPAWKSGNIPLHVYKTWMVGLLRRVRPDVIYMHHEPYGLATAQVYAANALVDRRPIGFYAAQNIFKQYPVPFRWFESLVLKHSDFCFPCSQGALDVLRQKGYTSLAEALPLPVDAAVYAPRKDWAARKRAELGITPDAFVIGYLGRLVEEKGLRNLLLAAKALGNDRWRCVLVGTGPFETQLRTIAAELDIASQLQFIGYVPHEEAPGWLSLFDVLVLASQATGGWKEQFGRVIVEANACRTPVIGTESGEIGNVLRDTGGGPIVPEADLVELEKALRMLQDDPQLRERIGEHAEAAVRSRYDQGHLAARFAATIDRATHAAGSSGGAA
jgi:glycosyltransferase involved in cell wall biosynthesis